MVDEILDSEIWDIYPGRRKDFVDAFREMKEESQDELLHNFIYGLEGIKEKLYKISSVAEGTDRLNEPAE